MHACDPPNDAGAIVYPDYGGGSIVNVVSSLLQGLGGESNHPPARALSPSQVRTARNVVLMVLDGLGYDFLSEYPHSFLYAGLVAPLTSVFPSTTASAITTFTTGQTPAQHGLTGWFTYLRELGSVATVLPFRPRHGGPSYAEMGIDPRAVFHWTPVADQVRARAHVVSERSIVDSHYSRCTGGSAQRHSYGNLEEFFARITDIVRTAGNERRYVYAYWPHFDRLAHGYGIRSPETHDHFQALDRQAAAWSQTLAGTDTLVVACADHGLIDTSPAHTVTLAEHPELAHTLALPLCGEPRVAYCYVHPAQRSAFERYVNLELGHVCDCVPAAELLEQGRFGPDGGKPHPELRHRIGDYALITRGRYILRDALLGEHPFCPIGVHGGISAAEMQVPLLVWER